VEVQPGVFLQPQVGAQDLRSALLELGAAVGGSETTTEALTSSAQPNVAIYVGGELDPTAAQVPAIALAADGWKAWARTGGPIAVEASSSPNPLGPQLAACVGAGFAFTSAWAKQRPVDAQFDLWGVAGERGPELDGIHLPAAYLLGLGAVGAAFGYALASARGIHGALVAIDPQDASQTDLNRLLTATWDNVGESKEELFRRLFAASDIRIHPFKGRWPGEYLGMSDRELPDELRVDESAGRFRWIVSCVDRDRDRADIAARLPRHVLSGSTFGMAAQTFYFSSAGPCECLGCRHRTPRQLGVEKLTEQLRSLGTEERRSWYDEHGASAQVRAAIEEYLSDPTCAGPGAADLAKLGVQGRVDWAVGFVSAAAGVLLAARFIRTTIRGVDAELEDGSEARLFFWTAELRNSKATRVPDCPTCGVASQSSWFDLWDREADSTREAPR
jgi:molybdopterin/thiamine biosynthesis adenylyltransferase